MKNNSTGFFRSIRGKQMLILLAIALIPLITVSIIVFINSQNSLKLRTTNELQRLSSLNTATITDWLENRRKDMVVFANDARVQSMDPDQAKQALDVYYNNWGRYESMSVQGLDGKSIATYDNKPVAVADRAYFKEALTGT